MEDLKKLINEGAKNYCRNESLNIRREDCSYCISDFTNGAEFASSQLQQRISELEKERDELKAELDLIFDKDKP